MGVLVLLIGGAIGLLSVMKDDQKEEEASSGEPEVKPIMSSSKKRSSVKTDPRPMKKDMAELSFRNRDEFKKHESEWIILSGEIKKGEKNGLLTFSKPAGIKAQLVRGTGQYMTGKTVKVIGWMIDEHTLQVDGIQDVEAVEREELLPKKDLYTKSDYKQLSLLKGELVNFEGTVKKVRSSQNKLFFYLVFETDKGHILGVGQKDKLKENGVTEEALKTLVGKEIELSGKVRFRSNKKGGRLSIVFSKTEDFKLAE